MATTIVTKKGSGAPAASDLVEGELAVDTTNGRLYTENSSAAVVELGSNPSGNITFADNGKAIFGAGSDLQIYHDGSHSVIADFGTGDLRLNGVSVEMRSAATGASYLRANNAGSVDVYHNGSAKLATTNTGIDVTGTATMDGLTVSDGTETTSIPATADRLSFTGASLNYIQSAGSLFVQPTGDLVLNGSGAEIMRLKSGNAGIGTSSPNVSLEVDGGTANGSIARFHNNGDRYLELSAESDGTYDDAISVFKKNSSVGQFAFRNPTTEYMRIDSSGNVGIGTSSPSEKLQINDGRLRFLESSQRQYNVGIVSGTPDFAITDATYSVERMRIDSSGNVGIGTSSPTEKLQVNGKVKISNGGNLFIDSTATDVNFAATGSQLMRFEVNGSERMRIDSSGNWMLGTTDASAYASSTENGLYITSTGQLRNSTNGISAYFNRTGSEGTIVRFNKNGTSVGGIQTFGGNLQISPATTFGVDAATDIFLDSAGVTTFKTNGTENARIDSSGNLLVGGTAYPDGTDTNWGVNAGGVQASSRNTSSTAVHYTLYNANGAVGSISTSGSATAYNTSSDQRLKENIADADDAGSKVDAIQVRSFDWKADGSHQDYGMIAQELIEVAPEAVSAPEDPEEMMSVDYSKLVPMLVKEIQQLRQRVAQLEE